MQTNNHKNNRNKKNKSNSNNEKQSSDITSTINKKYITVTAAKVTKFATISAATTVTVAKFKGNQHQNRHNSR